MASITAHHQDGDAFVGAVNFVIDVLEGGGRLIEDSGGATRWGVSKRANPDLDIASLTRDEAVRIYHERYWLPCHGDQLPPPIALPFFAAYVNMSPRDATKCLQRALGTVKVDGVLGPKTLGAARRFRPQCELRARFTRACVEFYVALTERVPFYVRYRHGWIGRVARVADEAGAWGRA